MTSEQYFRMGQQQALDYALRQDIINLKSFSKDVFKIQEDLYTSENIIKTHSKQKIDAVV